ncbi:unnamed protein product, partial [Thelazia callipaeda]|uniref:DUF659 domain-containing protein n=1 Tax=Thelazia callipaeda TaxID=103827 RepID=A0A0N5CQ68_THECL
MHRVCNRKIPDPVQICFILDCSEYQKKLKFGITGLIKDVALSHNYIFMLVPVDCCIYVLRIDSLLIYYLKIDATKENWDYQRFVDAKLEVEAMSDEIITDHGTKELAHLRIKKVEQFKKLDKIVIENMQICSTTRSCFLAFSTHIHESSSLRHSLVRIFTEEELIEQQGAILLDL